MPRKIKHSEKQTVIVKIGQTAREKSKPRLRAKENA